MFISCFFLVLCISAVFWLVSLLIILVFDSFSIQASVGALELTNIAKILPAAHQFHVEMQLKIKQQSINFM